MNGYLAVMIVGAFGCGARLWMATFVTERYNVNFPIGTLAVNVVGCFLIGLLAGITRTEGGLVVHPMVREALMIGFLGGFTTFSSFGLQTIDLFSSGEWGYGSANIVLSVVLCLTAVWIGQILAGQLVQRF